jgi:hypothetical protein
MVNGAIADRVKLGVSGLQHGNSTMLIMYRGYELAPVKVGEGWKVHIHSGGKPIATTIHFATEATALAEARKIEDDLRAGRR